VAAHEEEQQGVVPLDLGALVGRGEGGLFAKRLVHELVLAPPSGRFGAKLIGHPARGDLDEPSARIVRHPFFRPFRGSNQQRFLHRVLGGGEIAVPPDDRAEHLRRQLAQQVLARSPATSCRHRAGLAHGSTGGALITSRTSIARLSGFPPGPGAAEARAAIE
jgi:hypothetical protein